MDLIYCWTLKSGLCAFQTQDLLQPAKNSKEKTKRDWREEIQEPHEMVMPKYVYTLQAVAGRRTGCFFLL